MAFEKTSADLKQLLEETIADLEKAVAGNKAAAQRCRTKTVKLEKVGKEFRKASIANEKK